MEKGTIKIDFIIILGLKLEINKNVITMANKLLDRLHLAQRIFASITAESNEQVALKYLIPSGRGSVGVEAEMMATYLIKNCGINEKSIIVENRAMTTVENFMFSFFEIEKILKQLNLDNPQVTIHVVTSESHRERSKRIYETIQNNLIQIPIEYNSGQFKTKFYGSLDGEESDMKYWKYSIEEIESFQNPAFNWIEFLKNRYIIDEEQVKQFLNHFTSTFKNEQN